MRTRRAFLGQASAAGLLAAGPAFGQSGAWPQRPLKVLVPLPAGGVMDGLTRIVCDQLAQRLGQPVVVENKPGANGMLATTATAQADPDGYTILSTMSSIVQNVSLHKNPSYRMEELLPISPLGRLPIAFIVPKSLGIASMKEFMAKARERTFTYGTYGIGSSAHIIGEVMMRAYGIKIVQVPFRGEAPALTAIAGGQVDSAFVSVGGAVAQADKAITLCIANPARMSRYPDLPTFDETGFPVRSLTGFSGFYIPSRTPKPIADRLSKELREIVRLPMVVERLLDFGFERMDDVAGDFPGFVDREVKLWAEVIRDLGIQLS